MMIVKWESNAVESEATEEFRICILEEIFKELIGEYVLNTTPKPTRNGNPNPKLPCQRRIQTSPFQQLLRAPGGSGIHNQDSLSRTFSVMPSTSYSPADKPEMKFSMLRG